MADVSEATERIIERLMREASSEMMCQIIGTELARCLSEPPRKWGGATFGREWHAARRTLKNLIAKAPSDWTPVDRSNATNALLTMYRENVANEAVRRATAQYQRAIAVLIESSTENAAAAWTEPSPEADAILRRVASEEKSASDQEQGARPKRQGARRKRGKRRE